MRTLASISLSFLLLLQTVNFGATEVLRMGDLLQHVQLHSDVYGDSFTSFLNKHYGSLKDDHLASHEGHDKLPFNHTSRIKTTLSVFIFHSRQVLEIPAPVITPQSAEFSYTNTYTSLIDQDIFQPPKKHNSPFFSI